MWLDTYEEMRGTAYEYYSYIKSEDWHWFREYVFRERGRRCQRCGASDPVVLQIHHLHYETLGCENLEDVQVVCIPCHGIADAERRLKETKDRWPYRVYAWATKCWGDQWQFDHDPLEVEQQFINWLKTEKRGGW